MKYMFPSYLQAKLRRLCDKLAVHQHRTAAVEIQTITIATSGA